MLQKVGDAINENRDFVLGGLSVCAGFTITIFVWSSIRLVTSLFH